MRSLDDWTRYLEQQEQALEQALYKPAEEPSPPEPIKRPIAEPAVGIPVAEAQLTPAPTPASEARSQVKEKPTVSLRSQSTAVIEEDTEKSNPKSDLAQKVVKQRRRLPQRLSDVEEVAQRSYKDFKETREELLQRLLDPQLSLEDAARILNVCPTTVRRYTNRGVLKHVRTAGNQRRFRLSDVLAFLESQGGHIEEL